MAIWNEQVSGGNDFGTIGEVVTPAASDLPADTKSIVCLTSGDVTVVPFGNSDGDTLAFVGVSAGFLVPYRVRRVTAATATVATVRG